MAFYEPKRFCASSLDNFYVFQNSSPQELPYAIFPIADSYVGSNVTIRFADADNDEGVSYVIQGSPGAYITSSSFNTAGDRFSLMFSLIECLRLNPFVYDVVMYSTSTIRFGLDSSRRWSITAPFIVAGNYREYNPVSVNKWVVNINAELNGNTTRFSMSKYNDSPEVSFNVTSPFQYITFKKPARLSVSAYSVRGNVTSVEPVTNTSLTVLPTTLSKFETVDYNDYFCSQYNYEKKYFLTRLDEKPYNYGEKIGLSMLTDRGDAYVTLRKKYYTNSGTFLTSVDGCLYKEYSNYRYDFYDDLGIAEVENSTSRQVGYVEVCGLYNGNELTYPVRYVVTPKCNTNDTIFFINAIGGIDSFNFSGGTDEESSIDEQVLYRKNPKRPFSDVYELDYVKQKSVESVYKAKTGLLDRKTAEWLRELQRSRYAFKWDNTDSVSFKMITVTGFDINLPSSDRRFSLECEYRYADQTLSI